LPFLPQKQAKRSNFFGQFVQKSYFCNPKFSRKAKTSVHPVVERQQGVILY
jgi:hypothetical protein